MNKKLMNIIKMDANSKLLLILYCMEPICKGIPDPWYLKLKFWLRMRTKLDLEHPKTFNEKMQWLKLYDRNPAYTALVDKYEVRQHITKVVGEEYLIPMVGVWEDFERIDFADFPNEFVLKCTHDSGGVIVCKDKATFDFAAARKELKKRLARNYYHSGREWPYKNIMPQIICEEFLESESGDLPNDYKFHCFNGKAQNVMVCTGRATERTQYYFFDREWNYLPCLIEGWNAAEGFTMPKPEKMDEMFAVAERLSKDFPFVRVDLYFEKGQIYFGELTFYPQSGFDHALLPETDELWGREVELPS